jgi:chemotaxis protein MotB
MGERRVVAGRKKQEGGGVGQGWLMTFSDMVTLLLCFFVLLFLMSTLDAQKFMQLVSNLQGNPYIFDIMQNQANVGQTGLEQAPEIPEGDYVEPSDSWMIFAGAMSDAIGEYMEGHGAADSLEIDLQVTEGQIIISIRGDVLFETLRADLTLTGIEALDIIMSVVMGQWDTNQISEMLIHGHADIRSVPPGAAFEDNLELSGARAASAWRYIVEHYDIPRDRIGFAGYGEYRPVGGNFGTTEEEWYRNRRVEVVLIRNFLIDEETGVQYHGDDV